MKNMNNSTIDNKTISRKIRKIMTEKKSFIENIKISLRKKRLRKENKELLLKMAIFSGGIKKMK